MNAVPVREGACTAILCTAGPPHRGVATALRTLGWDLREPGEGDEPADGWATAVEVTDEASARTTLEWALTARLLVVGVEDGPIGRRTVRDLVRIATVVDRRGVDVPWAGLDATTLAILVELGRGATVDAASRTAGCSLRTAHRRLAQARSTFGVDAMPALVVTAQDALAWLPRPEAP